MTRIRRFLLPALLIAGLVAFFASGLHHYVTFDVIAQNYAALKSFTAANLLASYLGFMLAYAIAVAFSLPIALPLTLTGGAILGWPAVGLVVIGATTGAAIVFTAARSVLGDFLRTKAGPFMAKLEAGFSENAFSYLLALRLVPAVPFWVTNIVPAMTSMRLSTYCAATFIGIIPGTTVFIWVGRGFDHVLAGGRTPDLAILGSPEILLPLAGIGALALLPIIVRWWQMRRQSGDQDAPKPKKSGAK